MYITVGTSTNQFDLHYALQDLNKAYTTIENTLKQENPAMVINRAKIDEELVELHGIHASSSDVQNKMETAMLSGILWTTLAVTLVYFAFRKL